MKFYKSGLRNLNKKIKKNLGRSYKSKIDIFYPKIWRVDKIKKNKIQNSNFIFLED